MVSVHQLSGSGIDLQASHLSPLALPPSPVPLTNADHQDRKFAQSPMRIATLLTSLGISTEHLTIKHFLPVQAQTLCALQMLPTVTSHEVSGVPARHPQYSASFCAADVPTMRSGNSHSKKTGVKQGHADASNADECLGEDAQRGEIVDKNFARHGQKDYQQQFSQCHRNHSNSQQQQAPRPSPPLQLLPSPAPSPSATLQRRWSPITAT